MIYILEFKRPLGNPNNKRGQAQYYIGYCDDDRLEGRLDEHAAGRGARITAAAAAMGIGFDLVLTIPGDRSVERKLKSYKNTPKLVRRYRQTGLLPLVTLS